MNIWLHRIKHEEEISLLLLNADDKQNRGKKYTYLPTGWSNLGTSSENIVKKIQQNDSYDKSIEKLFYGTGRKPSLLNFIKKMKKGDLVLVPTSRKKFSIYKLIEDDPISVANFIIPTGFKNLNGKLLEKNSAGYLCHKNNKDEENIIYLGFFRKVKKIATFLSRDKYINGKLKKKMKYPRTNLQITECKKSVEDIIKYFRDKRS